ncbi:Uncharacterised protein [Serratia marcescens]|uniref:Uncharacterized protein n=1 Tax=Serratia marcescens TaxID=615 RepID=A0A379YRK4_SERMA|nr:Uncharacterised protein [Serratia marcescens]
MRCWANKALQQAVHLLHHLRFAVQLVRAELLNGVDAVFLHVTGHDAGESAAQRGGQLLRRLVRIKIEVRHVLMGRLERQLQIRRDADRPVKAVGVAGVAAVFLHQRHGFFHLPRHFRRIVDDDGVMAARFVAQRVHDELVQHAEVVGALFWPGQDQRQHLFTVLRVHQDTQQVQQLFGGADAAREDNDAMRDAHEGFQAFFDVRHDHQLVHQRVRRLGGDDRRLGHADEAAVAVTLLRVTDRRAFHRRFHRARPAAGADVQLAQAQLAADLARVQIFVLVDRVAAPAHHHVGIFIQMQRACIAQDGKYQVGDVGPSFPDSGAGNGRRWRFGRARTGCRAARRTGWPAANG